MEYPKNGSVLVVDDKYEEIESLLRVLNQNKVPTFYFNGNLEHFPEDGFENIRLVFLDINLDEDSASGGKEKIIIGKLMAVLRRAINKANGQYIVATWSSMADTYYDALITAIQEDTEREDAKKILYAYPSKVIKINKADMKTGDEYDLGKIKEHIEKAISESSFLPYYISWENMVLESSKKVLNIFDKVTDDHTDIARIIALFAQGSNMVKDDSVTNDILQYGFTPLSSMLINELQNNISDEIRLELIDEDTKSKTIEEVHKLISSGTITDDDRAKINTIYHIDDTNSCASPACSSSNGQVYLYEDYLKICCSTNECNIKWAEDLHSKTFDLDSPLANKQNKKAGSLYIKRGTFDNKFSKLEQSEKEKAGSKDDYVTKQILDFISNNVIPVFLEISPACDVSKNKRKKMRLIFGVMIPTEYTYSNQGVDDTGEINYHKEGDNFTDEIMIQYKKQNYKIVFDLQTITGINLNALISLHPIFRFKKEFVTEVQHSAATHISRPGFFNMRDYK